MTALRIRTAALVYGGLAALAVVIGVLRGNLDIFHHPGGLLSSELPLAARMVLGGAAGVAFGLGIAGVTRYTVYRYRWAEQLHIEFRGLFGPLKNLDILAYAAISAVSEEMFFRGAVQPILGILLTSLVFGALHVAPGRKFIPWPLQALTMGLAFGGLFWLSGDLSAPIMAHFTINYQNLHFINRYDPSLQLPRTLANDRRKTEMEGRH
jgi:uncharacterized protein